MALGVLLSAFDGVGYLNSYVFAWLLQPLSSEGNEANIFNEKFVRKKWPFYKLPPLKD